MEFKAKRRTLKVTIEDDVFNVRFPLLGELAEYRKDLKAGVDGEQMLTNFLAQLGLPVEAQLKLEGPDMQAIVDLITDQKKV